MHIKRDSITRHQPEDMTRTLLYDGSCGLCAKSVQFVLSHERTDRSLRFAPLQGPTAAAIVEAHPELRNVDSVILAEEDEYGQRVFVRSAAVRRILRYVGGPWRIPAAVAAIVPRFVLDGAYDIVARTRYGRWGRDGSCLQPMPEERVGFLP